MGFLRDVATAFKPSNIARGLDAARNPPTPAELEAQLPHLTPEQRAAYDANMARVEQGRQEARAAWEEASAVEDETRVLRGPAGRYVHGSGLGDVGSPDEVEAQIAEQGLLGAVRSMRAERKGEFRQALRQTFNVDEVKQLSDPAERDRVARAERAARDAAAAPYRAPDAAPVAFGRLATRGETQLADVLAHLHASGLAARPDRVFGVYRVPDRISTTLTPHSERGRYVEWDIVHAPAGDLAPGAGPPPVAASFVGAERWVARRPGEPSVLDEDLALGYCLAAGVGPERCAGLARMSEFRALRTSDDDTDLHTFVRGVVALHPAGAGDPGAYARLQAAAPLPLPTPQGVHVEVLNWAAVARAVHLKIFEPPPVPSPFPYLPATPQELLRRYLEIVGVQPEDCYSAQATVDRLRPVVQGGLLTRNWGARQPCADGKPRTRAHMCEQVVVVHRDTPAYAAGRERWAAYQRDVLQARLERGMRVREPVAGDEDDVAGLPTAVLRAAVRVAEKVDWLADLGTEKVAPHRYCWPPVAP